MENSNGNTGFNYTYSAKEQAELKKIRAKYLPREEDKLERLRRLDRSVVQKAQAVSLILGIIGALILGLGMSLAMTEIGDGLQDGLDMVLGIIIGVVGGIIAALAYPAYNLIEKRERARIAPEVLRLTDELIK